LHPGITVDQVKRNTGWKLKVAEKLTTTPNPKKIELENVRALIATSSLKPKE